MKKDLDEQLRACLSEDLLELRNLLGDEETTMLNYSITINYNDGRTFNRCAVGHEALLLGSLEIAKDQIKEECRNQESLQDEENNDLDESTDSDETIH